MKYIGLFILGVMSFRTSQILIRIPILNYLNSNLAFSMFSLRYGLLVATIIVLTSGIFEEGGRFLFRNFLIGDEGKPVNLGKNKSILDPVVFGLGHGLCEAAYFFLPLIGSYSFMVLLPGLMERVIAIVFHVGMTVLVFKGFEVGKKYSYTLLAMLIHSAFNYVIVLNNIFKFGFGFMYGIWIIADIILMIWVYKQRNVFRRME